MDIKLNDILQLSDEQLKNTKIRFNLMFSDNWNPVEIFKNNGIIQGIKFLKRVILLLGLSV